MCKGKADKAKSLPIEIKGVATELEAVIPASSLLILKPNKIALVDVQSTALSTNKLGLGTGQLKLCCAELALIALKIVFDIDSPPLYTAYAGAV
jgi:hypothetical protein